MTSTPADRSFADVAGRRIFLVLVTLRDPKMAVSEVFALAHSGFSYRPIGLFVIPFSFSFALLLIALFSLGRHIASPSKIVPLRFFTLPDDQNRQRRAIIAGKKLWTWGALLFSALTIAQLFFNLRYGKLASGLLPPRVLNDLAFFFLWTTAFVHVISAHHSLPLLRATSSYEPPRVLARPLFRPFSTTATILTFPLLLLASLASAVIYDSQGIFSLHSSIRHTSQRFADAFDVTIEDLQSGTNLGPASYAEMEGKMAEGWRMALRGTGSTVKVCALAILLIALCGVETRVYLRYWQLSKNAKREDRLSRSNFRKHPEQRIPTFRPNSRQSQNRQHAFVPTLPFQQPPPASLPMCRAATRSSTASSSRSSIGYAASDYNDYDTYDLRSATPYTTLPRYATPLERCRSSESALYTEEPIATPCSSSLSTQLPYRAHQPRRSSSLDSTFTDGPECLPYLSHNPPPPSSSQTPTSSYLDRAYNSQEQELEKYRLARPRSAARRPGRQMSWEVEEEPADDQFGLGAPGERRTYDTLPIYASRAGSRTMKRVVSEEDLESSEMTSRSWSVDSYTSQDSLVDEKVDEEYVDGSNQGGYAGPSSRCLKAMMKARLADALWSSGILTVFALLFVVKAVWGDEIMSSTSLAFFVLVFEHTLPGLVLFVYFSISYCRDMSGRVDENLFKTTRWGRDLNEEGWWIPSDEANRSESERKRCSEGQ